MTSFFLFLLKKLEDVAWPVECNYKLTDNWLPQKRSARPGQSDQDNFPSTILIQTPYRRQETTIITEITILRLHYNYRRQETQL